MVCAIISLVAGVIIEIYSLTMSPNGASQQTVQYLGFVCAAIFEVGGLIMIAIVRSAADIRGSIEYYASKLDKTREKKKCKKCGQTVDGGYTACPGCGSSDLE